MTPAKQLAARLMRDESEKSEQRYTSERAGRDFEAQAAKAKGQRMREHDSYGIERIAKALMR